MLTAFLTDIHGNREALEACLAHVHRRGFDRIVFLGDYVGYGADPGFVVDTVMASMERGAIALLGNHDAAAAGAPEHMNDDAMRAIEWTRRQLTSGQRNFLERLPLTVEEDDRLFVHASAHEPAQWDYLLDADAAMRSFGATDARLTFCGHIHVPVLYHLAANGRLAGFEPQPGAPIPLSPGRFTAVIGAVGQPRDSNPDACYAVHDDDADTLTYVRVPYDIDAAAKKIRAAGLPRRFAARLAFGQ